MLVELEGSRLRGVIYDGQLSDGNYEQNRALAKRLAIGETLEVLILDKDLKARTVIATAKKSLIDASKSKSFLLNSVILPSMMLLEVMSNLLLVWVYSLLLLVD